MNVSPLLTAVILAGLFSGCGRKSTSTSEVANALPPVKADVIAVRMEQLPAVTEITGTVKSVQRAQLAAKIMGTIEDIPVTLGQRVQRDEILVTISAVDLSARVAQAQSQLNAATRDLERERGLLGKGASTADMVKALEDRRMGAEAGWREAEAMLGYATLRAPFDAVVARKLANAGDLASPGRTLLELDGVGAFEIHVSVPESLAAKLVLGAAIPVEIPATGASFNGELAELSSAADPDARAVSAKIAVPPRMDVRSGQFARVKIPGRPKPAILVPQTAVSSFGQMERVFVLGADGRAQLRLVRSGGRHEGRVELVSGLADGDRVILPPPAGLRDGQRVEVRQ